MSAWDESRYGLGVAEMDATHREFLDLVAAAIAAPDEAFPGLYGELREHTRRHFEHEALLMRRCRFSAIGEHEREHLRVLGELAQFARGVTGGRIAMARAYVRELPNWFNQHLVTMDSALAASLKAALAQAV